MVQFLVRVKADLEEEARLEGLTEAREVPQRPVSYPTMRWIRVLTQMILCRCELSWSCCRRASAALARVRPLRRRPVRRREGPPRSVGLIRALEVLAQDPVQLRVLFT